MKISQKIAVLVAATAAITTAGVLPVSAESTLNGGGSTFMSNMMDKCAAGYNGDTVVNTNRDTVSYSATGSGTGKSSFANNTYKFGGSESAYSSGAPANFVYVPLIAGPIALGYRLDGVTPANSSVQLRAATVGKIFAGTIKMWNDPAIVADNTATVVKAVNKASKFGVAASAVKAGSKVNLKVTATAAALKRFSGKKVTITRVTAAGKKTTAGSAVVSASRTWSVAYVKGATYAIKVGAISLGSVTVDSTTVGRTLKLPSTAIRVAYRTGNSGTTNMFTNYLNKAIPSIWTKPANDAFTTAFPLSIPTDGTFQAASGNDGVSNYVRDNNGAITYAELSFVNERASAGVRAAAVANNAGRFVLPTTTASSAFYAEAAVETNGLVMADYSVQAADAYLINAIAFGLAGTSASSTNAGVKSFFGYFLSTCAPKEGSALGYAALSGSILTKALAQVAKINAG